jgi:phosphatidate cytidylyltransferase
MLKQRIITALALLAVLLPALFYPRPEPFCAVALVLMVAGAWEWARINGSSNRMAYAAALLCFAACAGSWQAGLLTQALPVVWTLAGAAWVLMGAWLLHKGVPGWGRIPQLLRQIGGLLALWLAWLAVAQARHIGINFLLSILLLVWVADVFAYFAGRAFGRRKLALSISPGKSWEGVWGGMAGVMVLALAWVAADLYAMASVISLYTQLVLQDWWLLPLAALFLAAMSVVGDLVESLVKRSAGVKDSSGLLPGHGGVLDRVDALLPTLPLAMMLHTLIASQ